MTSGSSLSNIVFTKKSITLFILTTWLNLLGSWGSFSNFSRAVDTCFLVFLISSFNCDAFFLASLFLLCNFVKAPRNIFKSKILSFSNLGLRYDKIPNKKGSTSDVWSICLKAICKVGKFSNLSSIARNLGLSLNSWSVVWVWLVAGFSFSLFLTNSLYSSSSMNIYFPLFSLVEKPIPFSFDLSSSLNLLWSSTLNLFPSFWESDLYILPNKAITSIFLADISSSLIISSIIPSFKDCNTVSVNPNLAADWPFLPYPVILTLALIENSTPVALATFFKKAFGDFLIVIISLANFFNSLDAFSFFKISSSWPVNSLLIPSLSSLS